MESQPRLLDQMRAVLRLKHLSFRTAQAYVGWVKRFILFHDKRHPKDIGAAAIRAFLTYLATHEPVAASTQNGALNALLFLYRSVLQQPFPHLVDIERAKRPRRLPTVFTRDEVHAILTRLTDMSHLMASLLYGAGLRLMECVLPQQGAWLKSVLLGHYRYYAVPRHGSRLRVCRDTIRR